MPTNALTVILVLATTSLLSFAADNTIGTWKRNIVKSSSNRPSRNPYMSLVTVREAVPGGVRVKVTSIRKDGTREAFGYTAMYDGTPVKLQSDGPFDMLSVKQVDENTLVIENWKNGGGYRTKSSSVVSPDGKTMTNTRTGVDGQGNEIRDTIVYDKQ
jgi:hypothetical protein